MVHEIALSLIAALVAMLIGWFVGQRYFGDREGIIGYALGGLTLLAGITWTLGV